MRSASIRNLIIGYSLAILVVLLIIWITFSSLRSQEKELSNISKTRSILQRTGPAMINLKEFENNISNSIFFKSLKYQEAYQAGIKKLRQDSIEMTSLAGENKMNSAPFYRLANLGHEMIFFGDHVLNTHKNRNVDSIESNRPVGSGTKIVAEYKTIIDSIETEGRKILSSSYSNSIDLTRKTFDYVRIISAILIFIFIISFFLIYRDIRNRAKKQEQLKKFNEELEKQVTEKTATIQASEKKYRSLIEQASDAIMVTDEKGNFVEVNTALCNKFGYTREELMHLNVAKLIEPANLEAEPIRFDLLSQGHSVLRERRMIHKDGTIVEVEANVRMLPDGRLLAIARDITERKRASELIIREKNLSDTVINSLPGVFYIHSLVSGNLLRWNENYQTVLGQTRKEIAGSKLYDNIVEEDKEKVKKAVEIAILEGTCYVEARIIAKHGIAHYYLTGLAINYENQPCILGTGIDISDRIATEGELIEAEAKFRNLVEQSPVGVYIFSEGKMAYVNPMFAEIFGYERKELTSSVPIHELAHPNDQMELLTTIKARLSGEITPIHYELRGVRKNKERIIIELFGSRTQYQGKPAIIGTLLDITQRKRAEIEKEKTNYQLNERVKELTALYKVSQILQAEKKQTKDIIAEILAVLPSAWQYSDITEARIVLGEMELSTPNFKKTPFSQSASFIIPGGETGLVEISYLEARPEEFEGPFLQEERNLINMLSEMLGIYLARQHEAALNKQMAEEMLNSRIQEQKRVIRAILNAEENERNKIGRELHDNVNQILASIKLYLGMIKGKDPIKGKEFFDNALKLVDNAIEEIRALSKSQVTPLKEINLEELIHSLIEKLEDTTSLKTTFNFSIDNKMIGDDLKLNIYRIVQEQLNNIIKYAQAKTIVIELAFIKNSLQLSITDDGKGFDPGKKRKGIGLSNMINRVESFNGKLEIQSSQGKGCRIAINIPLSKELILQ